jgi:hypothetical protein
MMGGIANRQPEALTTAESEDRLLLSPELVLVCPELREVALRHLPDRDPDGFLPRRAADEVWQQLLQGLRAEGGDSDSGDTVAVELSEGPDAEEGSSRGRPFLVAVGAYAIQQCVHMAVYAAVAVIAISSVVLLLTYFHSR